MLSSPYNEKLLLLRLSTGDESAFTFIYNKYYAEIFYYAKRIVDYEQARDITIEVFTKLWKNPLEAKDINHLLSILRRMTRNACIDYLRKAKTATSHQQEWMNMSDDQYEEAYFKDMLEAQLFNIIRREIDKLPAHLKAIFELAYYEGLKNSEIATRLNLKDNTVRTGKAEAIKLLRMALLNTDVPLILLLFSTL